jgi:CRP-like cAMP-binding protein
MDLLMDPMMAPLLAHASDASAAPAGPARLHNLAPSLRAHLAGTPALSGIEAETLTLLTQGAETLRLERSAIVFQRGSVPGGLFVVLSGGVKLMSLGPDQRARVVELFQPGSIFGEIGVFTGAAYRTWTEATIPTRLVHLQRTQVLAAVDRDHRFAVRMLTAVSERTQRLIDSFACAAPNTAAVRVAAYLLELSDRAAPAGGTLVLPASKGTIASLLNLSQESLSRALRRMMDAGLLMVAGRRIQIRDRNGLARLMGARATETSTAG